MRALHPTEARVTQSVLAGGAASPAADRLPRRTRQTVLRRLQGWGWFADRLVPTPACIDAPILTFVVARPFAERAPAMELNWSRAPETLVAWSSEGVAFGVFATPSQEEADAVVPRLVPPVDGRAESVLTTDLRDGSVPAYFDFEGAWVRIAGLGGTRTYPQGLVGSKMGDGDPDRTRGPSERVRGALRTILDGEGAVPPRSPSRGPGPDPPDDAEVDRMVRGGWLVRRQFLDPTAVARVLSSFPTQVVLVWGRAVDGASHRGLLPALTAEAQVAPFLFAESAKAAVAAFLGRPSTPLLRPRGGVLPVLRRHLTQIQSARLAVAGIRPIVHYRFGGLLRR